MWKSNTSKQRVWSVVGRYGLALASCAVALLLTRLVHPDALQSPIFFLAIILSAWLGGFGPGLLAAALSTLALIYFFLPPLHELRLEARYTPQLLVLFLSALFISSWSASRSHAEHALRRSRDELEEKVRQRTADLRLAIDKIPMMVWSAQPDGTPDFFNQRFVQYYGSSIESSNRQGRQDVVHPDDVARTLETWSAAVAAGESYEHEHRTRRADGVYRWCLVRAVPLRDQQGNVVRWYGTSIDIEDRKHAQESLQQSEAYLSEAQRLSHTGSFGWSVATGAILWSEETFRIFQYERTTKPTVEKILRRTHPDDVELVKRTIEQASRDARDFDFDHRLLIPDGSIKHVRVVGHAEVDKLGQCEFVGAVMDITASKEAEERIRQSERELRTALETIPAAVVSTLPDGSVDFASQRWLDFIGVSTDQILGWNWMQTIHPEDLEELLNKWRSALATGQPLEAETRIRGADGNYRWFMARGVALRDEKGGILKWYTTTHDIDDRKRAEQALQKSEAYLAEAQRLSRTGSIGWNSANGECFWSEETYRIYQIDRGTPLTGETILRRTHPDDFAFVRQSMESALQVGQEIDLEHRLMMPDGAVKHVHLVSHPAFNAAGDLVEYVGSVMDVTEHKVAAEALERSKNRFQAMVEKSGEGILLILPRMEIIYASASVERVLGYTPEEFVARPLTEHLHPDFRQQRAEQWNQLLEDPAHEEIVEILARHKDGSWRWIESHTRNLLNEPGVQAVVVNFRDITERKLAQAERERLEQRLRQAEKMEAVGRLAGGIAHDFNNVLAGIFAYGEMLLEETPAGSPLKRYAHNVLIAATRGRALVEQILAYSRSQRGRRAPVDVANVVAETLELLRGSLPAGIRLESHAPESPLVVIGDATQLHQVVMNLCSNAIQAMGGGGTLRVTLDTADLSDDRSLSHGTLAAGSYVRLIIEDGGSGMDDVTLSHIFEPFFTTKEIGRGTGLGLSLVYAIVTDSGGAIDVKSAPQEGSTFTIYLPLAQVALAPTDETAGPPPRGRGERVLLIDDEAPLLAATAEVLSRLGYKPLSFSDSRVALAAFEAAPEQFDVMVTDEVMPGLMGTALANVVRRYRPDLPIVLLSGYSGPILTQQAFAAGVSELLTKPLQSRELATTLTRVLHRTA